MASTSRTMTTAMALLVVAAAMTVSKADMSEDTRVCYLCLTACQPYVDGGSQSPTMDCCNQLKPLLQKRNLCMCALLRDGIEPHLGMELNLTLALSLPAACDVPNGISQCGDTGTPVDVPAAAPALTSTPDPAVSKSSSPPIPEIIADVPISGPTLPGSASVGTIVGVVIAALCLLIAVVGVIYWKVIKKQRKDDIVQTMGHTKIIQSLSYEAAEGLGTAESRQYALETIKLATNNFNEENKLGRGGFGIVYKGKLADGQYIAVKRLSAENSVQGDAEFVNEVLLLTKLQHRNLVRLLGFCLENNEKLLIYEFVANTSLDKFLFDVDPIKRSYLTWETRLKIIEGIARGMQYLHQDSHHKIVHRDLKTSNILLDAQFNPKISDFGLARLFLADETHAATSKIMGTLGYMAPEYAMHGNFSVKSDVYSFGVLVLEIISSRRNTCPPIGETTTDLLSSAWKNWREATAWNLVDPTLKDSSRNEILRCIQIGLLCVQENIARRPLMGYVISMLSVPSAPVPEPSRPAIFYQMMWEDYETSSKSKMNSSRDVTITDESGSRSSDAVGDLYSGSSYNTKSSDLYSATL